MKKILSIILITTMLCCIFTACSAEKYVHEGTCGTCTWTIDDNGLLTIKPTKGNSGSLESNASNIAEHWPWSQYGDTVMAVEIKNGVSITGNAAYMFYNLINCATLDVGELDVSKAVDMTSMFSRTGINPKDFKIIGLDSWNVSSVQCMAHMFEGSGLLSETYDIGTLKSWKTSSLTDASAMFTQAALKSSNFNIDASSWDMSNVESIAYIFASTGTAASDWSVGDLSEWNTSKMLFMGGAFSNIAIQYTLDLSNWDISSIQDYTDFNANVEDKVISPFK